MSRDLYEITHSESRTFWTCQRKHWYAYVERLTSVRKAPALWLGTYVHEGLDLYYQGKADYLTLVAEKIDADISQAREDYPNLWPEDDEKLEADKALVLAMLEGWPAFIAENDLDREFEIIATELEFEMRLQTPQGGLSHCIYRGKVDGVAQHTPTGNLFLIEHKTAKQVGDAYINQLQLDPQVPAYMAGIRECHGYNTIGCIYNILRTQLPGPRVKAPLFSRQWVWRNETEIAATIENLYWTYRYITRPGRVPIPNPSQMTCQGCAYRTLCLEDTPEARSLFTVKERKHSELEAS
jgi:CRISPR/Cas system-associated exonuclease Cas4 (RecB family)